MKPVKRITSWFGLGVSAILVAALLSSAAFAQRGGRATGGTATTGGASRAAVGTGTTGTFAPTWGPGAGGFVGVPGTSVFPGTATMVSPFNTIPGSNLGMNTGVNTGFGTLGTGNLGTTFGVGTGTTSSAFPSSANLNAGVSSLTGGVPAAVAAQTLQNSTPFSTANPNTGIFPNSGTPNAAGVNVASSGQLMSNLPINPNSGTPNAAGVNVASSGQLSFVPPTNSTNSTNTMTSGATATNNLNTLNAFNNGFNTLNPLTGANGLSTFNNGVTNGLTFNPSTGLFESVNPTLTLPTWQGSTANLQGGVQAGVVPSNTASVTPFNTFTPLNTVTPFNNSGTFTTFNSTLPTTGNVFDSTTGTNLGFFRGGDTTTASSANTAGGNWRQ